MSVEQLQYLYNLFTESYLAETEALWACRAQLIIIGDYRRILGQTESRIAYHSARRVQERMEDLIGMMENSNEVLMAIEANIRARIMGGEIPVNGRLERLVLRHYPL